MSDKKTSYYHQSRPEMLAIVPDGSKAILDVGCGGGDFGVGLQQKCPQAVVSGIEINQEVADRAPSIYTKVHVGDVHQVLAELPNASFDLIVFNLSLFFCKNFLN